MIGSTVPELPAGIVLRSFLDVYRHSHSHYRSDIVPSDMIWLPTAGEPDASHGCLLGWRIRIPNCKHPGHGSGTRVTLWTSTKYPGHVTSRNRPDPSTCKTIPDPGSFNRRRISSTGYHPSPGGVFRAPGPHGPDPDCSDPVMSLPDPRRRRAWWS